MLNRNDSNSASRIIVTMTIKEASRALGKTRDAGSVPHWGYLAQNEGLFYFLHPGTLLIPACDDNFNSIVEARQDSRSA